MAEMTNRPLPVLLVGLLFFLSGCEEENQYVAPPPPKVSVAQPLVRSVTEYLEFTGTTQAVAEVEVRARVPGYLESMHFAPATWVQAGDLLFVIDPREYEADLSAAKAELAAQEAELKRAETELARATTLFKKKAGAEAEVVKWQGDRDIAYAAVNRAKARVERAALNLEYTQVTAPISGRVSRNMVDPGNLVGESEPTLLTTVTKYHPIYAYINLNERDYLRARDLYRQRVKEMQLNVEVDTTEEAEIPVFLNLADETDFPHKGVIDFAESGIDPDTGTIQLRGVFANEPKPPVLVPGLFGRLRIPLIERPNSLLVSERAIGADQAGSYVLVVNSESVVEKRPVRLGQLEDGLRVIKEGIEAGERLVVNGLQRARPGAEVDPEEIDMETLTTSALRATAAKKGPDPQRDVRTLDDREPGASGSDATVAISGEEAGEEDPDAAAAPPEAQPSGTAEQP